jgi:hypothetical protein
LLFVGDVVEEEEDEEVVLRHVVEDNCALGDDEDEVEGSGKYQQLLALYHEAVEKLKETEIERDAKEAELEEKEADRSMEAIRRATAEQTVKAMTLIVDALKEQKEELNEELSEVKLEQSKKRLWADVEDSDCSAAQARKIPAEVVGAGERRMTKGEFISMMPKTKKDLIDMIPDGVSAVQGTNCKPYLLFPHLVLWQRSMVRKLTSEANMKEDHAVHCCAKCQSIWSRFTTRRHSGLLLKHSPAFCPIGGDTLEGKVKDVVDFTNIKEFLRRKIKDEAEEMGFINDDAARAAKCE